MQITPERLAQIDSFEGIALLLHDELGWPQSSWSTFDGVADLYGIDKGLGVVSIQAVQQLSPDQTWGIFKVDFGENELSRSQLRAILNKVAEKERQQHAERTWAHDNILFICRSETTTWTFGHYTGDKPATAKLKTFGWSDPLSARTFLTRNLPYLRWNDQTSWHKAWDADALTTEFYTEYKRVFELIERETNHPKDSKETTKLFVQSLFNRLMFIAFLEKMGWLSVNGSKDYLYTLFQSHKSKPHKDAPTFYNVLEHLFFNGLNSVNGIGGGHYLETFLGKVPYLNGGLFHREPAIEPVGITIPDAAFEDIFSEPNGLFRRFTFTVTESTPLDIDVAVDPEMLGKIFEELVTGRHESGSYYTPRPVVSFMCREGLKGYLCERGIDGTKAELLVDEHNAEELKHGEINDILMLLSRIKVVDPACGSGAYLLGMMRELFDLIQILERRRTEADPRELYKVKLDIIENNIYGVDIDQFAVNIARLRLWLSLAVDHKGKEPEPLPNLDYKIEAGDSLIAPNPTATTPLDLFRSERIETFDLLKREFGKPAVTLDEAHKKIEIKNQIDALRLEMQGWFEGKISAKTGVFDWRVEFAEVFTGQEQYSTPGGFDIVLANPPYVRQEGIKQSMGDDYKKRLVANYPDTGSGTADLFIYFYDRGLQLLKPGGMFVYISSNKWFKANYGAKLRKHIAQTTTIESITDFRDLPVFKSAMAYAMIFVARKQTAQNQRPMFTSVPSLDAPYPDVKAVIKEYGAALPANAIDGEDWTLADTETLSKLKRMKSRGIPLGEYVKGQIYRGVLTGFNKAFVIDGATRERLIEEDPNSAEIIKPLAVGKDIKRWRVEDNDRWLIFTRRGTDIEKYPAIKAYLSQWKDELTPKVTGKEPKGRKPGRYKWFEIQDDIAYYEAFEKPLIVFPDISKQPRFALTAAGQFVEATAFLITNPDLFLVGVTSSRSFHDIVIENVPAIQNGYLRFKKSYLSPLPIPRCGEGDRIQIENLVSEILSSKGVDRNVSAIEAEIDARVEFLYFHQTGDETYDEWKARQQAEANTEVGAVRALMQTGENDIIEFKSSVVWDIKQDKHNLVMRDEVLKEICAFLNADGGTILCGVDDDGTLRGLRKDLKHTGNKDKLGLVITNALGDLLTPHPVELVKIKFIDIDGETVLKIDVQPDPKNRYESPSTKKEDQGKNIMRTHVRIHASAKALEGADLIAWWDRRSKS